MKTYSELISLSTFEDRFNYLRLNGKVGRDTFGIDRYLNQVLYVSPEWRQFRNQIVLRDNGCDLRLEGYEIFGQIIVHHIDPITVDDVVNRSEKLFDPNNVVCVSLDTHNGIHYGTDTFIHRVPKDRSPMDTCPWKKSGGQHGR